MASYRLRPVFGKGLGPPLNTRRDDLVADNAVDHRLDVALRQPV
jgi:hypothetical protein